MQGILSTFSLIVVAVTLLANSIQAREVLRQTRVATMANHTLLYQNVEAAMCKMTKMLYENPQHRKYIYGNEALPADPVEAERVAVLAEMFIDMMNGIVMSDAFFDEDDRNTWNRYFISLASGSQVLQDYWNERRDWYQKPIRRLLDPSIAQSLRDRGVSPSWEVEPVPGTAAGNGARAGWKAKLGTVRRTQAEFRSAPAAGLEAVGAAPMESQHTAEATGGDGSRRQ
jgi:hypothetical protein